MDDAGNGRIKGVKRRILRPSSKAGEEERKGRGEEEKRRDARAGNDARGAERRMRRRLKRGAWEEPAGGGTRGGRRPTPVRLREPGGKAAGGAGRGGQKEGSAGRARANRAGADAGLKEKTPGREGPGAEPGRRRRWQRKNAGAPQQNVSAERLTQQKKTGRRSRESCCSEPCQLSVLSIHTDLTTDTLPKKISPFPK